MFASVYALFSGIAFLMQWRYFFALLHRLLHVFACRRWVRMKKQMNKLSVTLRCRKQGPYATADQIQNSFCYPSCPCCDRWWVFEDHGAKQIDHHEVLNYLGDHFPSCRKYRCLSGSGWLLHGFPKILFAVGITIGRAGLCFILYTFCKGTYPDDHRHGPGGRRRHQILSTRVAFGSVTDFFYLFLFFRTGFSISPTWP